MGSIAESGTISVVTPAKAGAIFQRPVVMDPGFRRGDKRWVGLPAEDASPLGMGSFAPFPLGTGRDTVLW